MSRSLDHSRHDLLSRPVDRRTVLYLAASGLIKLCVAGGGLSALAGCYRAPGTARDQLIFFSEEKEMAMGVSAFHEVLRQARLNENPEINEMVHRVGRRIAEA
ncbi:MAG: M48 family peptidase, partial [Gammaproteobacteria bacterium]